MFGWFKKQSEWQAPGEKLAPKQRLAINAAELAQLLLDEYVGNIVVDGGKDHPLDPKDHPLDPATATRYEAKTRLFQLAAVLMALKAEERQHLGFAAVREHIESAVFVSSADGGANLRAETNKAAQSLNDDLLLPAGLGKQSGIRWAHAWLDEIGVEDWKWNPITCFLIAHNWVNYYIMVVETLREFKPVAPSRQ